MGASCRKEGLNNLGSACVWFFGSSEFKELETRSVAPRSKGRRRALCCLSCVVVPVEESEWYRRVVCLRSGRRAEQYRSVRGAVVLRAQSTIGASHLVVKMRLLHHTALASLFATFGRVVYRSKLPSPSVLTPCDYRMLQSQAK